MAKRKAEDISGQIKEVEQDLVDCTAALKSGTYPELMRINDSLLRAKERREAMADKHRKLQIKNINELYEYELRDIEVQYRDAYEQARDRLRGELSDEARRVAAALQGQAAVAATRDKDKDKNKENSSVQMQALSQQQQAGVGALAAAHGGSGKRKTEALVAKRRGTHTTTDTASGKPGLRFAVPEGAMRADFVEIVADLQRRAQAFQRSAPQPHAAVQVALDDASGLFHLCVGLQVFAAGDLVTAFSALSQETFSGVVTSVSREEVSIRCGSGLRIAVYVRQLLEGRVAISRDVESYRAHEAISAAALLPTAPPPAAPPQARREPV